MFFTRLSLLFIIAIQCTLISQTHVKIGKQIWMNKNLNVSTFQNGDTILYAPKQEDWERASILKIPAWTYYNSDPLIGKAFGKMYNWFAVSDSRRIAPKGWHIPNNTEWDELSNFLQSDSISAKYLKAKSGIGYEDDANNYSGFSGLLGGYRYDNSEYLGIMKHSYFWITDEYSTRNAICKGISIFQDELYTFEYPKENGFYIRCIKDDTINSNEDLSPYVHEGVNSQDSLLIVSKLFSSGTPLSIGIGLNAGYSFINPEYNIIWGINGISSLYQLGLKFDVKFMSNLYLSAGYRINQSAAAKVSFSRMGSVDEIEHTLMIGEGRIGVLYKFMTESLKYYASSNILFINSDYSLNYVGTKYTDRIKQTTIGYNIDLGIQIPLYNNFLLDLAFGASSFALYDNNNRNPFDMINSGIGLGIYYQL